MHRRPYRGVAWSPAIGITTADQATFAPRVREAYGVRPEDIRFTLHTDSPCSPVGPLRLVQTAVTRACEFDNTVVGKDQAITVQRALEAITIDAARQIGMADRVGSLEEGKLADFTILADNPLTVDVDKIAAIKVSETWVNGEKKFG